MKKLEEQMAKLVSEELRRLRITIKRVAENFTDGK